MSGRAALVFPGQGSQRHGMLERLPDPPAASRLIDAAEALSGLDLRAVAADGTPEQLSDTRAAQPLLYLADWAWGHELMSAGLAPVAMAGHSLGELAALAVAGVFSVEAGLELVVERARLMAECAAATPGGMSAVLGLDAETTSEAVRGAADVWIANDNGPGQMVLSGTLAGIEEAEARARDAGAKRIVRLQVAGPFHSPLMAPAADAFADLLRDTVFGDASVPIVQDSDPRATTDPDDLKARLIAQIVAPVRWTGVMAELMRLGADTLIEAGPGCVLAGLARRVPGLRAIPVEEVGVEGALEEVGQG